MCAIDDPKLPALGIAVDREAMRTRLLRFLPNAATNGARIEYRIIKHAKGKRCVLEYWIDDDRQESSPHLIGKLYRQNRGARIFRFMHELDVASNHNAGGSPRIGMARPLAYLDDLGMIVQEKVPGTQISQLRDHHELRRAVRLVASNLAILHGRAVNAGPPKTIVDHMAKKCRPGPEALVKACPALAPLVIELVAELRRQAKSRAGPMCPSHGDLALMQIFIDDDRAYFIDFDGFCLAHPELDISNFLVAVAVHHPHLAEELEGIFLETYREHRAPAAMEHLSVYRAFIYFRRAMICFRQQRTPHWREQTRELLGTAASYL